MEKKEKGVTESEKILYLKGYSDGFNSAQKLLWYQAELLLIQVSNDSKDFVRRYIDKIKS